MADLQYMGVDYNSPTNATGPSPYGGTDSNLVAYQTVNPNQTVGGQLNGILAENGQYVQLARAQAQQQAAGRGLLNSTMAAGAGENAAIANSLPIAQGNAQEYAAVGAANQQAGNQYLGERLAANAQLGSSSISANASMRNAELGAQIQREQSQQQFQEYGMGLGYQYAQLGQQGSQFDRSLQQSGAQFEQQLNTQVGQFQAGMDFSRYQLGVQMQNSTQTQQAQAFMAIMQNPNMTATDRAAAMANIQSYFGQQSQFNAAIPAFVPPWSSNPDYWSTSWTQH